MSLEEHQHCPDTDIYFWVPSGGSSRERPLVEVGSQLLSLENQRQMDQQKSCVNKNRIFFNILHNFTSFNNKGLIS